MKNKIYCGIDGGLDGALSIIDENKIIEMKVMPTFKSTKSKREFDIDSIILFLKKYKDATVIFEKAQAMPLLGTVQAFNFGKSYGILLGVLSTLKMKYHIVHAKRWQKAMFTDINHKDTKQSSIIIAKRLYPGTNYKATERSRIDHHGITDSVLLATWGLRNNI